MSRLLWMFLILHLANGDSQNLPKVILGQGTVQGIVEKTISGRKFNSFYGIPYAKPPVGDFRFKEPMPAGPWSGTWIANSKPNSCTQENAFQANTPCAIMGSEDCLYVNVFTPKIPGDKDFKQLDVLIHIHGGGFQFLTSTSYGPEFILDRDIVYVTLNYRLGTLGFLSFEDDVLPGNNGLKDQNLALKWVKENIAAFGGDPNKITLSGMSAGGASVHYHILSKQSRGLFNKAIISSGAVSNSWALSHGARQKSLRIAAELGCLKETTSKTLDCLRERPAEIFAVAPKIFHVYGGCPISPIGPVIEKPSASAFIDKLPYDIITDGEAANIPLLWTYNSDEGLFPGAKFLADKSGVLDKEWDTLMPHLLELNYTASPEEQIQIVHKVREHYIGEKKIREAPQKFVQVFGDRYFFQGIHGAVKRHAEHYSSPSYVYKFSYVGEKRVSDSANIGDIYKGGACHGDDVHYVLKTSYIPVDGNTESEAMIKTIIDVWMNFIKGSIPSSWKPVKSGSSSFSILNIASPDPADNKVEDGVICSNEEFWESFQLPGSTINVTQARDAKHDP